MKIAESDLSISKKKKVLKFITWLSNFETGEE